MLSLRRASLTLATSLLLALPAGAGAAPHAGCANATAPAASTPIPTLRRAVLCLINQQRERRGLPPLRESWRLDRSAQAWTNTMVRTGLFSHGGDFSLRISAAGYDWGDAGENIATGFPTPAAVVRGWMGSTGHCQNILSPGYANVGTGVNPHPLGQYGSATWTQDFGLWLGHGAPSHNDGPAAGCPYRI